MRKEQLIIGGDIPERTSLCLDRPSLLDTLSCVSLDFFSSEHGIFAQMNSKKFYLSFPSEVWARYPCKDVLIDNLAYECALAIPVLMSMKNMRVEKMKLNTSYPLFSSLMFQNALNLLPNAACYSNVSSLDWFREINNLEVDFKDYNVAYPQIDCKYDERAVVNFSLGKESLLSFALLKELKVPQLLMNVAFSEDKKDIYVRSSLAKKLMEKENKKETTYVTVFQNLSSLTDSEEWGLPSSEWFNDLITFNTFISLPFAHHLGARYIVFGNEKSCDMTYTTPDGFKTRPANDQSSDWIIGLTNMTRTMTNQQTSVISLVEPIHEIAVMKVLNERYPSIAKFQMSCSVPVDAPSLIGAPRWCSDCSKCARIFLFLKALGIDPGSISFNTNMFEKKYMNQFSLFGAHGSSFPFDKMAVGRDEQLFAFYLAYKAGAKGQLIDIFREKYLDEARVREDELYNEFFGIHPARTVPQSLARSVYPIFREHLL